MIEDISGVGGRIEVAAEIAAARGNTEVVIAIVKVPERTIAESFAAINALRNALLTAGIDSTVGSLDALQYQLFLYGLQADAKTSELINAVHDVAQMRGVISRDQSLFSILITVAQADELRTVDFLRSYADASSLEILDVLAAASLTEDVADGLRDDLLLLIPAIVGVMLGILLFAFGHWRALLLPLFGSLASSSVVFSLLSIADISINLVTLLAFPIVLIVALANSCHFLAKSSAARRQGDTLDDSVRYALRRVATPYLISCLTTAVALASLGFNDIGPIRDLGFLASVSLLVSFLLMLLFAPWALRGYLAKPGIAAHQSAIYQRFSQALLVRRRSISALLLLMASVSALSLGDISVRSDARIFFPDNAAFTKAFHLYESRFLVFSPFRVMIRDRGGSEDARKISLQTLQLVSSLRERFDAVEGVAHVAMQPTAANDGLLLTAMLSDDETTDMLIGIIDSLEADSGRDVLYSSAQVVYESIDRQAMASLSASLWLSLLVIFAALVLMFRSVRAVLASVVANSVPLLVVFGVVWLVGDPLNLVTAFVFLVSLGVIVDDTIHLLYLDQAGLSLSGSSIEYSVVVSTVMLCAGLLLCQLSDFPTTRQFALYCALALSTAVASDLTLLPALLRYRDSRRLKRSVR